ncbi:MAG: PDZ domain-containing protein [Luteolibacter sp.]|uniref:S1C family serine protease n=1 Tax=Luteolibacter sp. TaxID=1962973 RepID=UPI0032675731
MNANWILSISSVALILPAQAQQSLESAYRTTGTEVVAAFETQRKVLQTSSAVILDGRKETGYGVVISPEGHILTKASEVLEVKALGVTVDQTNYHEVKILMIDPTWDVALLKIEATGLVPVEFAPTSAVPQGSWVMANGATTRTARRLLAGIVSAKIREVPAAGGAALGVILNSKSKALEVAEVNEKSGAKEAGLQKGDVILSIDGTKVAKIEEIGNALKDKKAGTVVKLTYRRNKEETTVEVRLAVRGELYAEQVSRNDQMSGDYSPRRSGFPRVLQHDILGSRTVQGGPLLDLNGHCIGMNIARANRAESFAIPVEDLKELAARLMKQSGN